MVDSWKIRWVWATWLFLSVLVAGGCQERPEQASHRGRSALSGPNETGWQRVGKVASQPTVQATPAIPSSVPVAGHPLSADGVEPMNGLARAPVGTWARYTLAGGFEQRLEIVRSSDREVEMKLEMWLNGRPVGLPATRVEPATVDWALRSAETPKAHVTSAQTTLTAAGRAWATRLTIARWIYEGISYERRTWTAADGPIYGVIRMVLTADDKLAASMELVAYGGAKVNMPAPR